jgi:GTP-binding protein
MIDKVTIKIRSGDGGSGAVTFRREKFVPFGGPDGGDGGKGGDIVIRADNSISNLNGFKYKKIFKAEDGGKGSDNHKHGKNGADIVLAVPVGTVVINNNPAFDTFLITDLNKDDQCVVVAHGGKGGRGNSHFASSTNQTPRLGEKGVAGEEKEIILELRLIADVGIIGYPNVGKSSLLAAASAAKPKIADYAFTTLEPMLGLVELGKRSFVMAEIPGLIAGAAQGKGLGHDFLRHVIRTRVLIHLIDGSSPDPVSDMLAVNNELALFDVALTQKPQIIAINKIDQPEVKARQKELKKLFKEAGVVVHFVSAASGEGVPELMAKIVTLLQETPRPPVEVEVAVPILKPQPRGRDVAVSKVGEVFIITAPDLERLIAGSDSTHTEVRRQIVAVLNGPQITRRLKDAGVKAGDKVRVGDFEWTW